MHARTPFNGTGKKLQIAIVNRSFQLHNLRALAVIIVVIAQLFFGMPRDVLGSLQCARAVVCTLCPLPAPHSTQTSCIRRAVTAFIMFSK